MMAAIHLSQGKAAEAIEVLGKAKAADPDYSASYFNIAIIASTRGEFDKAISEYSEVLKKEPGNVGAMLNIAALLDVMGKDSEALGYYMKAKATKDPSAYMALAKHHLKNKDTKKALAVLDEAVKENPKNTAALETKGRIHVAEKNYKDALKVFEEVEAIDAERGLPFIVGTYMAMGEPKKAMGKLNEKLNADPKRADLIVELAKVHIAVKDYDGAMENAKKLVSMRPDASEGYMVVAAVHESKGDLASAMKELRKGFDVDKDGYAAGVMLGDLYARKGDLATALKTYGEVRKRNPGYVPAIFSQGIVHDMTGRKKEAVASYREVLSKSGNHVPALNNLAYLCAEGFCSKEEALKLAVTAYRLDPGNGSILDTFGYALVKNGRHDDARKVLDRSLELNDNPSVRYHAALAYSGLGDTKKAVEYLEKAVAKGNFPDAEKAKQLLAKLRKG